MSWWKRLWQGPTDERLRLVRLALEGWSDEATRGDMRVWRDGQGDVLSLVITDESTDFPQLSDELAVREHARDLAESGGGGLIEARVRTGSLGETASLIYKRLVKPAYIYTGILVAPSARPTQTWCVVAGEHGTTGVREATITAELFNSGRMTIQDYESSWARDPYDPDYGGVDRSVLRFVSDDECYDGRFPWHPLSKVRRILTALPDSVHFETRDSGRSP